MTNFDKVLKEFIEKQIESSDSKTPRFDMICAMCHICGYCPIKKECDKLSTNEIEKILMEEA